MISYAIKLRRVRLSKKINELHQSNIKYGPLKNFKLSEKIYWGKTDRASMIFGKYEQEVLESITKLPKKYSTFIDLGAADGYYGVGLVFKKFFKKSYCFESSAYGRKVIQKNALINNVIDKVTILGTAKKDFFKIIPHNEINSSVLLVDIEGAEFDLFDKHTLSRFRNSVIYIEIHDWLNKKKSLETLKKNARQFFEITTLTTGSRDLSHFDELEFYSDTDRWLICSEGRVKRMIWLKLTPKKT